MRNKQRDLKYYINNYCKRFSHSDMLSRIAKSAFRAGYKRGIKNNMNSHIELINWLEDMVGEFTLYSNLDTVPTKLTSEDLYFEYLKYRNDDNK